jgi:hypothetical protein
MLTLDNDPTKVDQKTGSFGPVWSLWEMLRLFKVGGLFNGYFSIKSWIEATAGIDPAQIAAPIDDADRSMVSFMFAAHAIRESCALLEMTVTKAAIEDLDQALMLSETDPAATLLTRAELGVRLKSICQGIERELKERMFVHIQKDKADYPEYPMRKNPSVKRIADFFGADAAEELREARNCYAVELNTAAVFHAMRAAETGLHYIVTHIIPPVTLAEWPALEFLEWGKIIDKLSDRMDEVRRDKASHRSPEKEEAIQFFSQAIRHCQFFNNIWRKPVAHARGRYSSTDAKAALEYTQDFLLLLMGVPTLATIN